MIQIRLLNYTGPGADFWTVEIPPGTQVSLNLPLNWPFWYGGAVDSSTLATIKLWKLPYATPTLKWQNTSYLSQGDWFRYVCRVSDSYFYDEGKVAEIVGFLYWYPGMAFWAVLNPSSPPSVPQGTQMEVAVVWRNQLLYPIVIEIVGNAKQWFIDPDNISTEKVAELNQGQTAYPDGSGYGNTEWGVCFSAHVLNKSGLWKAKGELHAP